MTAVTKCAALAALVAASLSGAATAEIRDYEFRLVDNAVRMGDGVIVAVRLIDKRTGKAVPDAVIFARRIDMAPDDMATMTAPLEPLPASEPGLYRYRTNLVMAGGWRLSLAAKIQGETGTLESRLVLKVLE
ncbi:MAG: FixH family protein [Alphaproteobacteria bacterium]|nr:FixH family protein [Alphaproteobacteria bacterium]